MYQAPNKLLETQTQVRNHLCPRGPHPVTNIQKVNYNFLGKYQSLKHGVSKIKAYRRVALT